MTSTTGVKPERHTGELDLFRLYLDQAGRHQLLTRQDEVELSQAYQQGLDARRKLAELPITDPRRPALQAQAERGERARRTMIESNQRLVASIARRCSATGLPLADLMQEGNLGLLRAVEKFDWRMGCKFSTYATGWIRQAITRGAADRGARHPPASPRRRGDRPAVARPGPPVRAAGPGAVGRGAGSGAGHAGRQSPAAEGRRPGDHQLGDAGRG